MATTHQTKGIKSNPILNELAIADLMTVMTELIAVVQSENDLLYRGLPAALSDYAEQKDELTGRFADLSRGVLSSCTQELSDDEDLRQQIVTTGQRALPTRPLALGYRFEHPQLDEALRAALG